LATHDPEVSDATDVTPSLSVSTTATKYLPTEPEVGMFEIVNVDGSSFATLNDWSEPVSAAKVEVMPTLASNVQVPAPTY
jgi:hypothetical protein